MSKRDFTDERKRSSIPKMHPEEDPSSPFCTDLSLVSRGPVAQLRLSPDWIYGEKENSGTHLYSMQNFHPANDEAASICFFYRGFKISEVVAQNLLRIFAQPAHDLNRSELSSINEVLRELADPNHFDLNLLRTKTLNKKLVLVAEGYYRHTQDGRLALFLPVDENARVIQEIFYHAPLSIYTKHRLAATRSFDSIVWKK